MAQTSLPGRGLLLSSALSSQILHPPASPAAPSPLCLSYLQDGRKVVVLEGRGAALWCYVLSVPVVVL